MNGINFICNNLGQDEIPQKLADSSKFIFPLSHTSGENIADLSKEIKIYNKDSICSVPFCSTVEAEALGGQVNLGDRRRGPRINSFVYENMEDLKSIKKINFNEGRIKEVLSAVEKLNKEGEVVSLNIAGPFMILISLIDPMIFYKALKKEKEIVKGLLRLVENSLVEYIRQAFKKGVKMISFSDSVAAVDIVGPRVYKDIVGESTVNILRKIEEFDKGIVHLCGKTSVSLEKYGFIKSEPIIVKENITYGQAIIDLINNEKNIKIIGHSCMKKTSTMLEDSKLWIIRLRHS